MFSTYYYGGGSYVFMVLAIVTAIAATVLTFIFIIPEKKVKKLPKFFKVLHNIFQFKDLMIETILKAVYIFSTIFSIVYGFFLLFGRTFFVGLLTMLLGPIVIRLFYELLFMAILLVKNVIEINKKLKNHDSIEENKDI